MHPDIPALDLGRSLVVVSDRPDLAAALSSRLPRRMLTVLAVHPGELDDHFLGTESWPFMVVSDLRPRDTAADSSYIGGPGDGAQFSQSSLRALRARPVVIFWRGALPAGLPAHARSFNRFQPLQEAVLHALQNAATGMSLAPTHGVNLPSGEWVGSAPLEALVATHPEPFYLPREAFGGVATTLRRRHLPWRLSTTRGWARLEPLETSPSNRVARR